MSEPREYTITMCDPENPPEPQVTVSEIRWMGQQYAPKGFELRFHDQGHHGSEWQIWWWEPSYWTGKLHFSGYNEAEARGVFALLVGMFGEPLYDPDDPSIRGLTDEEGYGGRTQLSQAVSNRVRAVYEGFVPPIPSAQPVGSPT